MTNTRIGILSLCLMIPSALLAADAKQDADEVILLWTNGAPGAIGEEDLDRPELYIHRPSKETNTGCAVVVCPGGGYGHLAMGHEGIEIAEWFNDMGVTAAVLKYRIAPRYKHPSPMLDVQRAIRTVRARAADWSVNPKHIGVMGFSAGGHLASTAATHFDTGNEQATDPIDRQSCRPDFAILCYPVVSFQEPFTHVGSRNNLLGKSPDADLVASLSNETQVSAETPPTFLFHTSDDRPVPAENSIAFYLALRKHGVPAELHIYEKGRHGVGLAKSDPVLSSWPDRCRLWLDYHQFLKQPN